MYKQVETEESAVGEGGWHPVATLKDEYGGVTHVVRDDGCYILINGGVDVPYKISSWIYPEAFEVLKTLPPPTKHEEERELHDRPRLNTDSLLEYNLNVALLDRFQYQENTKRVREHMRTFVISKIRTMMLQGEIEHLDNLSSHIEVCRDKRKVQINLSPILKQTFLGTTMTKPYWHGDEPLGDILISYIPPDPVFQTTKGWYFCDEAYADACGPFETREKATKASIDYATNELGDCPACSPKLKEDEEWTSLMPNEKCWTHSVFNCGECFNR